MRNNKNIIVVISGICLLLSSVFVGPVYSEDNWARASIFALVNQPLSVFFHEEGHVLAAKAYGYEIQSVNIGFWGGEVQIKDQEKMNIFQSTTTSLAGPFVNRGLAVVINSYLDRNADHLNENVDAFLGTAYIWNRGSFAWYLFRSFFMATVNGDFRTDWGSAAYSVSGGNLNAAYLILGGCAALAVLDLYNSRDEISKNFDRMLGRKPQPGLSSYGVTGNSSALQIIPYGKGFIALKQWSF